jgi:hypothetical protein
VKAVRKSSLLHATDVHDPIFDPPHNASKAGEPQRFSRECKSTAWLDPRLLHHREH